MPAMRNASLSTGAINERRIRGNSLAIPSPMSIFPPAPSAIKVLTPPVIENLPPGITLTPPQLLSLHSQLLASGAFEPDELTRRTAEYRESEGRHVQKFYGHRWNISLLLHPNPQTGSCTPEFAPDPSSPAPTSSTIAASHSSSSSSLFITISLWCIATSSLDLDLSLYTRAPGTWLTRTLNPLAFPFLASTIMPQQPPQEPICVYLFDFPGSATLPTQPGQPWKRLPRLPRRIPSPPPALSVAPGHPHGQGLLSAPGVVDVRARAARGRARGVRMEGRGGARGLANGVQDRGRRREGA